MTEHANVFAALAAAQMEMEPVSKTAVNPAFKSADKPKGTPYADLSDVITAILPALNKHGIAMFHVPGRDPHDHSHIMTTVLHHGASGTHIDFPVPLMIGKLDMQSYKSATTYAKRIGSESASAIAPEDDDGNAAAKNPPARRTNAGLKMPDMPNDDARFLETPHDADGVVTEPNLGPTTQAWMDGIKDAHPGADPRKIAEATAAQLITDLDKYKTDLWLNRYLDGKVKIINALSERYSDLHAAVTDAIGAAHARIKGEEYDPSDFAAPGDLRSQLERSLEMGQ